MKKINHEERERNDNPGGCTERQYTNRATSDKAERKENSLYIIVSRTFPLAEAAEAHQAMANRQTTGKVVLLV